MLTPDCDFEFVLKILDNELLNILADWTNKKATTNPDIRRKYKGATWIHSWQWTDVTADARLFFYKLYKQNTFLLLQKYFV